MIVHGPVVGTDQLWLRMTGGVDCLDSRGLKEICNRFFRLGRATLPIVAAQLAPNTSKANLISISVLNNQPFEPVRMFLENAESNRATIILDVEPKLSKTNLLEKLSNDCGGIVESVCKGFRV